MLGVDGTGSLFVYASVVHRSVLRGLTNSLKKSEKAAYAQGNTLKDHQKNHQTTAQDRFKRLQESLAAWKWNIKK